MQVEAARARFIEVADTLFSACQAEEILLLSYYAEDSDFARINRSRLRQIGHVYQQEVQLTLIRGNRNAEASCTLGGDIKDDQQRLHAQLQNLRSLLDIVGEDPYLRYASTTTGLYDSTSSALPDASEAISVILDLAAKQDLVGLWASGSQYYGFANNIGLSHWYQTASFNLDASVHLPCGRAVKLRHAGLEWDRTQIESKLQQAQAWAELLTASPRSLSPGTYRVYLSPNALAELLQVISYSGFSRRAVETRRSPLINMYLNGKRLNGKVTLREDRASGFLPRFSSAGFVLPEAVDLVNAGAGTDLLCDRRSAAEFGFDLNAGIEAARSLAMHGGSIPSDNIIGHLDTGLYINNLWYTNLSELQNCQITGSTRFACFWVEQGRITAPLATSRFDDSLYNLLGPALCDLTDRTECVLDPGTYGSRSGASMHLPGVILDKMRFVM